MTYSVCPATREDIPAIASIHGQAFPRQGNSATWVRASLGAWPRIMVYVLVHGSAVAGYIFWAQKSGLRPAAVLELDQMAIRTSLRGRGLGARLIADSLSLVKADLAAQGQGLKSILVSTRADNGAQRLYARVLGARVVAAIDNLYSATEVLMLAEVVDRSSP